MTRRVYNEPAHFTLASILYQTAGINEAHPEYPVPAPDFGTSWGGVWIITAGYTDFRIVAECVEEGEITDGWEEHRAGTYKIVSVEQRQTYNGQTTAWWNAADDL